MFSYYIPAYFSNARYPLLIIIATQAFHNGFRNILKEDFLSLCLFIFTRYFWNICELFLWKRCPQENVRDRKWNTPSNVISTHCTFDVLPNSTGTFLWATISSFQRDHYYDYYFSPSSTTNNQYMHFFHSALSKWRNQNK